MIFESNKISISLRASWPMRLMRSPLSPIMIFFCPYYFNFHAGKKRSKAAKFFASLKQKIIYSQLRSKQLGNRVHETNLRYLWCRESSSFGRTHYHVAILLNHNAYAFVGKFNLENDSLNKCFSILISCLLICLRLGGIVK